MISHSLTVHNIILIVIGQNCTGTFYYEKLFKFSFATLILKPEDAIFATYKVIATQRDAIKCKKLES